ncbi:MAG: translation initiation factor IF-2 [Elusimicrobiota bacterium]|jgi:translation initiation factor IF-2
MEKEKKAAADKEKKDAPKKAVSKAAAVKSAEKKAPAARKTGVKSKTSHSSTTKPGEQPDVKKTSAEERTIQADDSIAPPTTRLGDPFARYRQSQSQRRPTSAGTPLVARLKPGEALPVRQAPAKPVVEEKKPEPAPAPAASVQPAPASAAPAAQAPSAAAPLAAPKLPASAKVPEPTATYRLDPAPAAVPRPVQPPAAVSAPAKPPTAAPPAAARPASSAAPAVLPAAKPGVAPGGKPAVSGVPSAARPAVPGAAPAAKPAVPGAPSVVKPAAPGVKPPVSGAKPAVSSVPGAKPAVPAVPGEKPAVPAPAGKSVPAPAPEKPVLKALTVNTMVTVRELSEKMGAKVNDLIKKLMSQGVFVTINQRLDSETAILVASDFGYDLEVKPLHMEAEITAAAANVVEKAEDLSPRPPVVTIMGHVDHGKTSLLDAIRKSNVVAGESGGITQHIGAYRVATPKGDIVFLDTPGHEAFTAMRARGSKVTDIVVLVVSAADGVMPQTIEAIDHAKAAGVPIVVAVNKIDLPTANVQKIRQSLAQHNLLSEDWGGKTIFVELSAKKHLNIDKLLEMLLLQSEMLELKANPKRAGQGTVVEAQMDAKRGAVATVLIQNGTVSVGDPFVMGLCSGKIKALITDKGERIRSAGPSTPVEILGISGGVPQAGDAFNVVKEESMAKEIAGKRNRIQREESLAHKQHLSLLSLRSSKVKHLPVILKADVQGSLEALKDQIEKLSTPEISVQVIHSGLGNANETDVVLAEASDAVVLLFHVDVDSRAQEIAGKQGVEVRRYEIIYDLTADVKAALEGLLEPELVDVVVGKSEVRQVFTVRKSKVAGSIVVEGKLVRGAHVKVFRGSAVVGEGKIDTLKRFKDDAKEVEKGLECGVGLAGFSGFEPGDRFEAVVKEKRIRRLESPS